ncbi:hypothetical protein B4147_2124 [Bacillus wiedmannii]|uniref:Uncharacterized protein n=1 Tax=Bacillus wiedmannii TaxID=1890302 RepID=A0A0G8BZ85_9BACI|nr:hypothetical protein [Bacillus wiedmannii]KKZ92888.1 hypothetical protein B4147_2124 [Bacillus wiedmannii]
MCFYWENAVKEFFKMQELERNKRAASKANCSIQGDTEKTKMNFGIQPTYSIDRIFILNPIYLK